MSDADVEEQNRIAKETFENAMMNKCEFCGRTFNGDRPFEIHQRSCTKEKPSRRVGQVKALEGQIGPFKNRDFEVSPVGSMQGDVGFGAESPGSNRRGSDPGPRPRTVSAGISPVGVGRGGGKGGGGGGGGRRTESANGGQRAGRGRGRGRRQSEEYFPDEYEDYAATRMDQYDEQNDGSYGEQYADHELNRGSDSEDDSPPPSPTARQVKQNTSHGIGGRRAVPPPPAGRPPPKDAYGGYDDAEEDPGYAKQQQILEQYGYAARTEEPPSHESRESPPRQPSRDSREQGPRGGRRAAPAAPAAPPSRGANDEAKIQALEARVDKLEGLLLTAVGELQSLRRAIRGGAEEED